MVDTTLINKLSLIFKFLSDNALIALVLMLMCFILIDLIYGKNKKNTKIFYIIILALSLIYIILSYYKPFLNIFDTYIANLFRITYFPSIIEYVTMLLITVFIQIISIRNSSKIFKHLNIWVGVIIEILFIINIVAMNNITVNLNSVTSIYESDLLLSIFQMTSIIFMIWIIINLLAFIVSMFLTKVEIPKLNKDYYE